MSKRPAPGSAFCCYCRRPLSPAEPQIDTSFTLDHVKAASLGGYRRVPCCRKCNLLKDNLEMDDWFWFIGAFARWWKRFDTPAQVLSQVQGYRRKRAYERAGRALPA